LTPAPYAEIDLDALRHNFREAKRRAGSARIMAVIKANGYGHGALRVATALPEADAFAVARVDEGVALREAGIAQRIAVLQGFYRTEELQLHERYRLEPVVHSLLQVELLETNPIHSLNIWLKLDSGMHRLGLEPEEFRDAARRLRACPSVRQPFGLLSHLACADDPADAATPRQLERFRDSAASLEGEHSLANSAGLLGWSESIQDWVRPGIMLYGVSPFAGNSGADLGLQPVMTLKTRLIAVKNLQPGDAVGYGGDWVCQRPTRLGIAAIGYGDGYPRHAGNGTPVLVNGWRAPIAGRVSMDMISVDLTDLPLCAPGDSVTLWGEGLPVETIARCAATIPYELLCGVTQRVRMVEKSGSQPYRQAQNPRLDSLGKKKPR
jgi:alanine racemase